MERLGGISKLWATIKSPSVMAIVALFSLAFAFYQTYFFERKAELTVAVNGLSRVFDVYQPVGGLTISYAGEDIRAAKKALWVMTLTVANTGSTEVRKGDYDANAPLGFEVKGASIVETPRFLSNSEYLRQNLQASIKPTGVRFAPLILDPGDRFVGTLLLLGPEGNTPSIDVVGKIAGVKMIAVQTIENRKSGETSAWTRIVGADAWWVQLARAPLYAIFFALVVGLVVAVIAGVSSPFLSLKEKREASRRREAIAHYRVNEEIAREQRTILELYALYGPDAVIGLKKITDALDRRLRILAQLEGKIDGEVLDGTVKAAAPIRRNRWLEELEKAGIVTFRGQRPERPERLGQEIEEIARYLKIDLTSSTRRADLEGEIYRRALIEARMAELEYRAFHDERHQPSDL